MSIVRATPELTRLQPVLSLSPSEALEEALQRVRAAMAPFPIGSRVVAAMSGGVDSAAVAALLKHVGYDVVGVTMQLYDHGQAVGKAGTCCAGQDIHDARQVADSLGIPHYVLDYESRFRDRVISPFVDAYREGETPIPCVACNSDLKFGELLDMAASLGAVALATGHYIQRVDTAAGPTLRRAVDAARDQSYFLFSTTCAQLAKLAFPLGGLEKPDVRKAAEALGLKIASKADSQDICFVPKGGYAATIERLSPGAAEPGDIVHVDGRTLGRHEGIIHYTIGQRKGLGVATGEPLFVVRLDAVKRSVVVGPRTSLGVNRIRLRAMNWLGEGALPEKQGDALQVWVRLRSSQAPQPAALWRDAGQAPGAATVLLAETEHGISSGQASVIYQDGAPQGRVLGGGWIVSTDLVSGDNDVSAHAGAEALTTPIVRI